MSKQVLVIGAGVIGLSSAWYALQRGHSVTILDRGSEQDGGCSYGNAGMIVPSHFIPLAAPGMVALGLRWMWNPESPFYIKPRLNADLISWGWKFYRAANAEHVRRAAPLLRDMHLASRACFEDLSARTNNAFGLVTKGLLMLCKTRHALNEEAATARKARELGVPAEVLNQAQTAALDPAVRMDVAGSVYFPKDCHLTPAKFMAVLREQIAKLGGRFSWQTEVQGWVTKGRSLSAVRTTRGEFTADEFVLSCGSWSPDIAKDLKLNIPIQAGKGYSVTLPKPPQQPGICSILTEARVAVTPMGQQLRVGGTMEIAGLNEEINPVRVQGIVKSVPRYFPEFKPEHFRDLPVWRGLRPCSPDGLPYLGRTARWENLVVATGHAMMGLSLGPISGQLVSDILSGEKPRIPLELLSPDRYG